MLNTRQIFAKEKYAIDAGSVRALSNGHREPNKWFSIVRGMIMFEWDMSRDCVTLSVLDACIDPLSNLVSLNCGCVRDYVNSECKGKLGDV